MPQRPQKGPETLAPKYGPHRARLAKSPLPRSVPGSLLRDAPATREAHISVPLMDWIFAPAQLLGGAHSPPRCSQQPHGLPTDCGCARHLLLAGSLPLRCRHQHQQGHSRSSKPPYTSELPPCFSSSAMPGTSCSYGDAAQAPRGDGYTLSLSSMHTRVGFTWQGFGSREAAGVASVR